MLRLSIVHCTVTGHDLGQIKTMLQNRLFDFTHDCAEWIRHDQGRAEIVGRWIGCDGFGVLEGMEK